VAQGVNYDIDLPNRSASAFRTWRSKESHLIESEAESRDQQLSREWRRRLHDVQERAGRYRSSEEVREFIIDWVEK
jgi:hypothetical protein